MKYRELDNEGDYFFGKQRFLVNRAAVGQAISSRMLLLYGEWWENIEDGLTLFEKILGTTGNEENKNAIDLIISDRILDTTDVIGIQSYSSNLENRKYNAHCTVNTSYGEINITIADNAKIVTFAWR